MLRTARRGFNPVLPILWLALLAGLLASAAEGEKKKSKKPKDPEFLRIYFESPRDTTQRAMEAKVGRSSPMSITIEKLPILSEAHMKIVEVVDQGGGPSLRITFNRMGKRLLENYTSTGVGRRLVVQTQFDDEARWLGAPRIARRNAEGILVFAPDASSEELDRLVRGLTKAIKKNLPDPDI
ncbi:MAG: hypothetical protein ACKVYV_04870 [Limisphaerales bacterium]